MGLERLKSAFSDLVNSSEIEGRHSESSIETSPFIPTSIEEATTYAWNSISDEPINPNGGIEPFDSPLLSDLYNNPETTTTLNNPSTDVRFQVGLGFPSPNMKAIISTTGFQASLSYIQTYTGNMFVASGAVTKLGDLSGALSKIGIDTPTFDFGAAMDSVFPPDPEPTFLTYPMQVEEMFNPGMSNLTDEFVDNTGDPDSTRGIVFQILGSQNKVGLIPDFSFQDRVKNEKSVEYINPILNFNPGNIEFKDDYFKDLGSSLGSLADALGGPIDDMIGDALSDVGDSISSGMRFISDNARIKLNFPNLSGFGNALPKLKIPTLDIDFSAIGGFFGGIGDSVGGFLGKMKSGIGGVFGGGGDFLSGIGETFKDIAGPIGNAFKDVAENLNPLEEFELPQIKLRNPRQVSVTDYGGQAIFRKNQPRALQSSFPIRNLHPSETNNGVPGQVENSPTTPYSQIGKSPYSGNWSEGGDIHAPTDYYPNASMDEKAGGDKFTNAAISSDYESGTGRKFLESTDNGMPFFFKDLRDGKYIILRGYLSGISDTLSPGWSEQSYVGRSEKTYIYTGADRTISVTLNLAAQTPKELDSIYKKVNRLTTMVYPEYMADNFLNVRPPGAEPPVFKTRMKPPLGRMRLGDLFGNPNSPTMDGLLGFLESLTYSFPDEASWEWRHGQRVPKVIEVSISWKVLHERVPDKEYPYFYGYNPINQDGESPQDINNFESSTAEETAGG